MDEQHQDLYRSIPRPAADFVPLFESNDPVTQRLLEKAKRAAASNATVLLTGESGTGKDVLAHQIHRWSPRAECPFVTLNCTGLSGQLLESELFGHMRGAFDGAFKDQPGQDPSEEPERYSEGERPDAASAFCFLVDRVQ